MWFDAILVSLTAYFVYVYIKYVVFPFFKGSGLNKPYEDFIHEDFHMKMDKKLIIRVYKEVDEYEVLSEISTTKIIDVGRMNDRYKWLLFEK